MLFIGKKDGGLGRCTDYRALNKQTIKNSYPLPCINNFNNLRQASVLTILDSRSGYNQICLDPESVSLTAFPQKYGLFEFRVLLFGLLNAPAALKNVENSVMRPYIERFVSASLDENLDLLQNET